MTEQVPHPDDSNMTPAMLSDEIKQEAEGKETPEKPAPEQEPKETPAEKQGESPKPEDKPEDTDPEEPKEKLDEPLQTKPRTIYQDLKEKKKEVKEAKSENELLKSQLAEKDQLIADLTKKAQNAETPAEKQEVEDEISEIAEKIGADPEGIKTLTEFLSKKLVKPDGVSISKEDLDAIKNLRQLESQRQAEVQFSTEWNEFEPSLKKEFPNVTNDDLSIIRKEVNKLAHTKQYHDKEIDYIYFKEKAKLSKLISPQRPSYEGSDNKITPDNGVEIEITSKSSPMDVMRATEKSSSSNLEIRSAQ